MSFVKKTWVDRLVQYPMRRILTKTDSSEEVVTVARNEGEIYEAGDPFNAQTMNDLEQRIEDAFSNVATTPKVYDTEQEMRHDMSEILLGEVVFTEDDEEVPVDKGDTIPVGVIQPFAGSTIPEGYLLCDGQAVSRTSYAELFTAIGTTWGAGDGSTTFNVPDLREVAPVGVGESTRTEGSHDVFTLGEFKDDQMQSHTHSYTGATTVVSAGLYAGSNYNVTYPGKTTGAPSGRVGDVTRGKRIGVNYIIKYRMVNGYINDHINASHVDFDNTDLPTTETDLQGAVSELYTDLSNKMTSAIVSTETAIGTFEGSTLYRKIITGSGTRSSAIIDSSINSNNCSPIKLYGYVTVNVEGNPMKYPIEFYSGDNTLSNINITHNGVNAIIKWSTRTITEWKVIIEYIKL